MAQASFAYNNSKHSAIKLSPFYANFGYHPRWVKEISSREETYVPEASKIAVSITEVHQLGSTNVAIANRAYARAYDAKRTKGTQYQPGHKVLLSLENVRTSKPSKKLDIQHAGPYTVVEWVGTHAYRFTTSQDHGDSRRLPCIPASPVQGSCLSWTRPQYLDQ